MLPGQSMSSGRDLSGDLWPHRCEVRLPTTHAQIWQVTICLAYGKHSAALEVINIRDIECKEYTAGTWQIENEMWHINSQVSASLAGCQFYGEAGAVHYEHNFGVYDNVNVNFRCTSSQTPSTQHWIGNMKWNNLDKTLLYRQKFASPPFAILGLGRQIFW